MVGLIWLFKWNIPIGIEGRAPLFYATGKSATTLGIFAIILGLVVALEIPAYVSRYIEIDRCLDNGGKWNNYNETCESIKPKT